MVKRKFHRHYIYYIIKWRRDGKHRYWNGRRFGAIKKARTCVEGVHISKMGKKDVMVFIVGDIALNGTNEGDGKMIKRKFHRGYAYGTIQWGVSGKHYLWSYYRGRLVQKAEAWGAGVHISKMGKKRRYGWYSGRHRSLGTY